MTHSNDSEAGRFPFSSSFQFRDEERVTLEAFFENVFFDEPLSEVARASVERIRYRGSVEEDGASEDASATPEGAKPQVVDAGPAATDTPSTVSDRSVILLQGADGIGKTRVFRHLRERARDRAVPVYEIYNYDVEGIPLKPFLHAIRQIVADLDQQGSGEIREGDPNESSAGEAGDVQAPGSTARAPLALRTTAGSILLERYRYALESLLPEAFGADLSTRRVAHRLRERIEADKVRIFDGITQLLLEVSARRPLLILVHDLHWADRATVELVRYIGRNLALQGGSVTYGEGGEVARGGVAAGALESLVDANRLAGMESLTGPEIEGFGDEWRNLGTRQSLRGNLGIQGDAVSRSGSGWSAGTWLAPIRDTGSADHDSTSSGLGRVADDATRGGPREGRPASRLLLLANYRSTEESGHRGQQAIESLGKESFTFHGELRPLNREETGHFLGVALEGGGSGAPRLVVTPGAVDRVHEASDGFPSFQQELIRGLYLSEPGLPEWSEETVRAWFASLFPEDEVAASAEAGARVPDADTPPAEASAGPAKEAAAHAEVAADADAEPRRFRILRRRLHGTSLEERRVLEVLALARRPISPEGVARILSKAAEANPAVSSSSAVSEGDPGVDPASANGSDGATQPTNPEGAAAHLESIELFDAADGLQRTLEVLRGLETRGLIECAEAVEGSRGRTEAAPDAAGRPRGGATSQRYHFRLWDYTRVVQGPMDPDIRRQLHQRLGELFRGLVTSHSSELSQSPDALYEVWYHLSRGVEPSASGETSAVEFGLAAGERFERSFAFEKARALYQELAEVLSGDDRIEERLRVLTRLARVSVALKDTAVAEATFKRIYAEGGSALVPERRFEVLLLEAEAARDAGDPARALKSASKAAKFVGDENTPSGAQLNIAITALRLERQDWKRATNFGLKAVAIAQRLAADPPVDGAPRSEEEAARSDEFLGTGYQLVARAFYRKGDYNHAVDNYQRALEAAEGLPDSSLQIAVLDEIGRVYLERGNYFRAARYLYKALEERRRRHDVAGLCRSYDQLGLVYRRDGDYHKCIENLNRSLHLKERIGDYEALNPTLGTLGDLYFRLGDYPLASEYFRREVVNCRRLRERQLDETGYLVDSFCRQAHVYLEVGNRKKAESLVKQVLILTSEFKLRSQEADGLLLDGNYKAQMREWVPAEKSLKQAGEIFSKLGHRIREACALLDMAEVKFQREFYDEALKLVSKAQIIADDVKALDLRVRALTIKGNTYRFLKGGNPDKAKELLNKALELSQNLNDVRVLFQLFYSLAKTFHTDKEFSEASSYYGKAETILERIGDRLGEDERARYFEDPRRKVFAEDLARFRKEAQGRSSAQDTWERPTETVDLWERPASTENYKGLLERILRVSESFHQLGFPELVLRNGLELVAAERGLLVRVHNRQYQMLCDSGFERSHDRDSGSGDKDGNRATGSLAESPERASACQCVESAIRRGRVLVKAPGESRGPEAREPGGPFDPRAVIVVPLMTDDRIFGGLYLDRAASLGRFTSRDQSLLEAFARHVAVAFQNRQQLDVAVREPLTGFLTPSYFIERLREEYRRFNLHGKTFSLTGFYLPALEDSVGESSGGLAEKLGEKISEVVPGAAICWGNPILYLLFRDVEPSVAEEQTEQVVESLEGLLHEQVASRILQVESRYQQGSDMYFDLRRRLLPEECDQKTLSELRRLLADDITLKEAKRILEKHIIENTLRKTGGNITHAAKELGIHRPQLSNYLKRYGLKRERYEREFDDEQPPGRLRPIEN